MHTGKAVVDAMTFSNVTQQQISAQLGLALRNDAINTNQLSILADAEVQKIHREAKSSRGILQNAVDKKLDTYDSLSKGITAIGGSFGETSNLKNEQGQRTIGGNDGIVGNGLF